MSAFLALSLLFVHLSSNAQMTKIYYAPIKGEFIVVQAKESSSFDKMHPLGFKVYVGPAKKLLEQPVADYVSKTIFNFGIYLRSGPVLIIKTRNNPLGMSSRYVYSTSPQRHISSEPYEDLIELEVEEFDLSHKLNLVDLDVFKRPGANASGPTVQSILQCAARLSNP